MIRQDDVQNSDSLRVKRQATILRREVYMQLRFAIIHQDLPPGSKLIERELCERLRISRPSLREAFHRLEAEKLIKIIPHKGAVVSTLSSQNIREVQNVRTVLGAVICDKFVETATEEDTASISHLTDRMKNALRDQDQKAVSSCLREFQEALLAGSGDMVCREIVDSLDARVEIIHRLSADNILDDPQMRTALEAMMSSAAARNAGAFKTHLKQWLSREMTWAVKQKSQVNLMKTNVEENHE